MQQHGDQIAEQGSEHLDLEGPGGHRNADADTDRGREQRMRERTEQPADDHGCRQFVRPTVCQRAGVVQDVLGVGEADTGQARVDDAVDDAVQLSRT